MNKKSVKLFASAKVLSALKEKAAGELVEVARDLILSYPALTDQDLAERLLGKFLLHKIDFGNEIIIKPARNKTRCFIENIPVERYENTFSVTWQGSSKLLTFGTAGWLAHKADVHDGVLHVHVTCDYNDADKLREWSQGIATTLRRAANAQAEAVDAFNLQMRQHIDAALTALAPRIALWRQEAATIIVAKAA